MQVVSTVLMNLLPGDDSETYLNLTGSSKISAKVGKTRVLENIPIGV